MQISRQFTFINNQHGFTVSAIEGTQLISELAKIHNIGPHATGFYQKTVLSSLQMVNFIKPGESLGFYIDSDEPYYRFKIEISQNGTLRTLLLPEEFDDFPHQLSGKTRIVKIMQGRDPYTSILEFKNHPLENIINEVMDQSYQTNSKVLMDENSSTSLMITKLPPSNVDKKIKDFSDLSMEEIEKKFSTLFQATLTLPSPSIKDMEDLYTAQGFTYLISKEVKFHCPCSRERMVENIFTLPQKERTEIFSEDDSIEIRCDYCNTIYDIKKEEILKDLH